jgi:hypothetical protein
LERGIPLTVFTALKLRQLAQFVADKIAIAGADLPTRGSCGG